MTVFEMVTALLSCVLALIVSIDQWRIRRLRQRVEGLVALSKATGIRFDANEKMLQSLTWSVSQLSQQGTSDHYRLKHLIQGLGFVETPTPITKH